MANSLILAGFGMAVLGMSGRIAARSAPRAISNIENLIKSMPLQNWSKAWANSKYYKGGFQLKMTKREVTSVKFSPNWVVNAQQCFADMYLISLNTRL